MRSTTATANAEAEFVVDALLALLRRVPVQASDGMLVGRELGCAAVGLIGMTPAARECWHNCCRCLVVGCWPATQPIKTRSTVGELGAGACVAAGADGAKRCHQRAAALLSRYRGLIGERILSQAKPGQVLVSLSHSAVFR